MKRYLFVYHATCEFYYNPSYKDRLYIEEIRFPKGTTDWEVSEAAQNKERIREHLDPGFAGEGYFTRTLQRILEIGREIEIERG